MAIPKGTTDVEAVLAELTEVGELERVVSAVSAGTPLNPLTEDLIKRGAFHAQHLDGYGYCPRCNAPGFSRERRLNGNDRCKNGHEYPSRDALTEPRPETPRESKPPDGLLAAIQELAPSETWREQPLPTIAYADYTLTARVQATHRCVELGENRHGMPFVRVTSRQTLPWLDVRAEHPDWRVALKAALAGFRGGSQ